MTEHALEPSDRQVRFLPSPHEAERVWRLAQTVSRTEFVPGDLRGKPEAVLAAMLTGREIGIGPMHALRGIDVIDGRPSLSPELMASLVYKAGHDLYPTELTGTSVTVIGRRRDWPESRPDVTVRWDLDDARRAGLVGLNCQPETGHHDEREVERTGRNGTYTKVECGCRQGWRTYPRAMLRARATSELCRAIFPDVVERTGYVHEELGGDPQPHDDAMEVVAEVSPEQAARVAETFADDDVEDAEVVRGEDDEPETIAESVYRDGETDDRFVPGTQPPQEPAEDAAPEPEPEPAPEETGEEPSAPETASSRPALTPEGQQRAQVLVRSATVDAVKAAVEAGDVTAAEALAAERAGQRRTTLVSWLEGKVWSDDKPAAPHPSRQPSEEEREKRQRELLAKRVRVALYCIKHYDESAAVRLQARVASVGLATSDGHLTANLDRMKALAEDLERGARERGTPGCSADGCERPQEPGQAEHLCAVCAAVPFG